MESRTRGVGRRTVQQILLWVGVLAAAAPSSLPAQEHVDLATVNRIKVEAFQNSKVMDQLFWLTDVHGPRLTGSPGFRAAADWTLRTLQGWGASNAHLEKWGTFGRGWSMSRFSLSMVAPTYAPLEAIPKAWSGGTSGPVTAEVVLAPLRPAAEREAMYDMVKLQGQIQKYVTEQKGKLRGKVVLLDAARELDLPKPSEPLRYDAAALSALAAAPEPSAGPVVELPLTRVPVDRKKRRELFDRLPFAVVSDYFDRRDRQYQPLWAFLRAEGVAAVLVTDRRGDGGLLFAESVGGWDPKAPLPPSVIVVAPEPYNRLVRLVEKKLPVKVDVELAVKFDDDAVDGFNVIAEIPGGKKKDEVVMLGAHLDSWHAGTGATDNAAGSAMAMEAFRILKALNLPMDRTVRLALWGGEEQGLLGSTGYVQQHFGDLTTLALKPEQGRISAYFNLDNGSGKVRGIYLQGNDMVRPIFTQWLEPFHDMGAATVTLQSTGGTDHETLDAIGIPAFQFIQDPLDYENRTHHSAVDTYDHVQAPDLMQASAILAWFVYNAANRPAMLPRKPLPKPPVKQTAATAVH